MTQQDVAHELTHTGIQTGYDWRPTLTFVPDPMHQWEI